MKKFILLVCLISSPVFAMNCSKIGDNYIYSNTPMHYTVTSKYLRNKPASSEALGALFAGAGLASGRISLSNTPAIKTTSARTFLDPYIVNINKENYVLVKDSKDNNWSIENIVGFNDNRNDLFASLKSLESDGDITKISAKELKKAGIRFVHLNADESLALNDRNSDYDINKVQYIDMANLRTALGNKNQDGTFGYFYVIVKESGQKIACPGRVTFEDTSELNRYIHK